MNKVPVASNLVKKTNYDQRTSDFEFKYFAISDYNKFSNEIKDNEIKENELVKKIQFWVHNLNKNKQQYKYKKYN